MVKLVLNENLFTPLKEEVGAVKNKKRLNEGPGTGYTITSKCTIEKINSLSLDKIDSFKENATYGIVYVDAIFNCDVDLSVTDLEFSSYYFGGSVDREVDGKATKISLSMTFEADSMRIDSDFVEVKINGAIEDIKSLLVKETFDTKIVYGGGWSHVTYDGTIAELSDVYSVDYTGAYHNDYDTEVTGADAKITEQDVIDFIDKDVQGDNVEEIYYVLDEVNALLDSFGTFEEAKDYAFSEKDAKRIVKETAVATFDGDVDYLNDYEIVWEADDEVEESLKLKEATSEEFNTVSKKRDELAEYLGIDKDSIRFIYSDTYVTSDGKEYLVLTDEQATNAAINEIKSLYYDIGLESFTDNFVAAVIDNGYVDEYFFEEVMEGNNRVYAEDIKKEDGEHYASRLIDEMVERGVIGEDDIGEDGNLKDNVDEDEVIDLFVGKLNDDYTDAVEWYKDQFGFEDLKRVVKEEDLVDIEKAAKMAIDWDGRGHFLSYYDGEEIELPNDLYAYKIDENNIDGYDSAYEIFDDSDKLEERVNWISFDKFDKIKDKYVHGSGEGDTMAQQMISAVKNIVDSWYRDGNVYDNSYELGGNRKDISTFANWLYTYIPETKKILDGIKSVKDGDEYEDLLNRLYYTIYQDNILNKYSNEEATDSIFDCAGNPFVHNSINESVDLKEKAWKKTLNPKIAMNLRNAVRNGDIPKIKEALKEAFRELYRISPDDFYEDEIDEKIEDIDFIDDDDEEEIDGILGRFYDICDDLSIWIPISESIVKEDTVKTKDGKWANVGKDGKVDSGKFRTKKEADAQRKAMYANWK